MHPTPQNPLHPREAVTQASHPRVAVTARSKPLHPAQGSDAKASHPSEAVKDRSNRGKAVTRTLHPSLNAFAPQRGSDEVVAPTLGSKGRRCIHALPWSEAEGLALKFVRAETEAAAPKLEERGSSGRTVIS